MDLGLLQREVAARLGVRVDTIRNWEVGRFGPALWQWPPIIRFLSYVPFSTDGSLPERLKAYRQIHGLSQKRLAALLGVDPTTVLHWERGGTNPKPHHFTRIAALLEAS